MARASTDTEQEEKSEGQLWHSRHASYHTDKKHTKRKGGNRLQLPSLCLLTKPGMGVFIHRVWSIQVHYVRK